MTDKNAKKPTQNDLDRMRQEKEGSEHAYIMERCEAVRDQGFEIGHDQRVNDRYVFTISFVNPKVFNHRVDALRHAEKMAEALKGIL